MKITDNSQYLLLKDNIIIQFLPIKGEKFIGVSEEIWCDGYESEEE